MELFLTADHHFGHLKICEMTNRPFASVEEMNETLIANHNAVVKPGDRVIFLGDVCMGKLANTLPLVARMNGHKILILGNHDRPSRLYHHKNDLKKQEWLEKYQNYFEIIQETMCMELCRPRSNRPSARLDVVPVLLHHLPYRDDSFVDHSYEGRYKEFQPIDDGKTVLLHGHIHNAWKQKGFRQINVGVDVWGYKPVHIDQIITLITPTV